MEHIEGMKSLTETKYGGAAKCVTCDSEGAHAVTLALRNYVYNQTSNDIRILMCAIAVLVYGSCLGLLVYDLKWVSHL